MRPALTLRTADKYTPLALTRDLRTTFGAAYLDHLRGADLAPSGDVTTWTSAEGHAFTNQTAAAFVSTIATNGRRGLLAPDASDRRLLGTLAGIKAAIIVCEAPALPFASYATALAHGTGGGGNLFTGGQGASSWFLAGHYRDGVAENAVAPAGLHIYETATNEATSSVYIGGSTIAGRVWRAGIYDIVLLSAAPDASQRAAYVDRFKLFHHLP